MNAPGNDEIDGEGVQEAMSGLQAQPLNLTALFEYTEKKSEITQLGQTRVGSKDFAE
jgi:hypothetical protein